MAKRKKNRKNSSGGAFGNSKSTNSNANFDRRLKQQESEIEKIREMALKEQRYDQILVTEMEKNGISGEENIEKYFKEHFQNLSLDEALEKYGRYEDSPRGRCEKILDESLRFKGNDISEYRSLIESALEEDPNSIDALLLLAKTEPNAKAQLARIEKAVETGRELFADLIEEAKEQGFGHFDSYRETFPLLSALKQQAEFLEMHHNELDTAIELYREMLSYNQTDMHNVTADIARLQYLKGDIEGTRQTIEECGETSECGMLIISLTLSWFDTFQAATKSGWTPSPADPQLNDAPGEGFEPARKRLRKLLSVSPWVPALLPDIRIMELPYLSAPYPDTAEEALFHSQKFCTFWTFMNPMAGLWLLAEFSDFNDQIDHEKLRADHLNFENMCRAIHQIKIPKDIFPDEQIAAGNLLLRKMSTIVQKGYLATGA